MSFEHLDTVLKKHLNREAAPANLWNHVRGPLPSRPGRQTWVVAAVAAAAMAGAFVLWTQFRAPQTVEALAIAALDRDPSSLTLRTEDAASIRKWVRNESGIDIPLPPKHSPVIRIQGATINPESPRMAEVSYQVGEFRAALLVTKNPGAANAYPKHDFRGSDALAQARVTSWTLKGQNYTLAWTAPGEFRTACLLCHDQEPPVLPPTALVN